MQPVAVVLLLAIAVAPAPALGTSSTIINKTCAGISAQTPVTPLPSGYCTSLLSDVKARKASSTLSAISYLVDDLNTCHPQGYREMVESLAGVLDDYRTGRFDDAATAMAENVTMFPMGCCDIVLFHGVAGKNHPFSQENDDNDRIANLASDIAAVLVSGGNT
jgi:hypothetical protein